MLFNSYPFIFLFLPIVAGQAIISGWAGAADLAPVVWLALASLAFYSFSNWQFVALLLGLDRLQLRYRLSADRGKLSSRARFAVLTTGRRRRSRCCSASSNMPASSPPISTRLFATGFAVNILLPVGISFYTFTQIAFLVDAYQRQGRALRAAALRAVRHLLPASDRGADPAPQGHDPAVRAREAKRPHPHLILCGLIIFAIGLFKKTCLADGIQPLVAPCLRPERADLRSGLDRRAGLHVPALFRFLRLFRHGDRPRR